MDGWYEQCLMCGHRRELKKLAVRHKEPMPAGPDKGNIIAV